VLRDFGVLTRDDLRERSGARDWSDDSFAAVLGRAVAEGSIKDGGEGLFELGPRHGMRARLTTTRPERARREFTRWRHPREVACPRDCSKATSPRRAPTTRLLRDRSDPG
jgi:hypothetical protein